MKVTLSIRLLLAVALIATLGACGSDDSDKSTPSRAQGPRISVMPSAHKLKADSSLSSFNFALPEPAVNLDWTQNGGTTDHAPGNLALSLVPQKIWSRSIGSGSGADYKLLAAPIIVGKTIFAMDAKGFVGAYEKEDGDKIWRVDTAPSDRSGQAIGGGIAYGSNVVYATTGFGEVLALRASSGDVIWRRMVGKPLRSAPTTAEGRVFAITIENETYALDASNGQIVWKHNGIAENATLMGASSPALRGDTLVVAYSSGELFGLRAQNGRVAWGDVLAVPTKLGALPAIADIRGLPVMDRGRVFAISHSGRMASIDERTGNRAWEADIGGTNTPVVAGNALFLITNERELVAVSRDGGRVIWLTELQKTKDPSEPSSKPVAWYGPVLAGGRLWLTNSLGHLAAYAPDTGYALYDEQISGAFYLPPVIAGREMILLNNDGDLIALR